MWSRCSDGVVTVQPLWFDESVVNTGGYESEALDGTSRKFSQVRNYLLLASLHAPGFDWLFVVSGQRRNIPHLGHHAVELPPIAALAALADRIALPPGGDLVSNLPLDLRRPLRRQLVRHPRPGSALRLLLGAESDLQAKGLVHTSPGQRPGFIGPGRLLALKARLIPAIGRLG